MYEYEKEENPYLVGINPFAINGNKKTPKFLFMFIQNNSFRKKITDRRFKKKG